MASLSQPALPTAKTAASFRPSSRLRRPNYLPIARRARKAVESGPSSSRIRLEKMEFPTTLESTIRTEVKRAKKSRCKKEKEQEEEILMTKDMEFDPERVQKFDVYMKDEDDKESGGENSECGGSSDEDEDGA